ncbi:hypothetical protein GCM10027566_20230 [Arachidicoccus ginsenosidivorans]|uniref:hypothetical protein n=1 Tax=Arachidicoccus ginsenosidivorans TaxID=496057 RepID=UPI00131509E5|nr:hypothetical protein [Arachidicoccus ginsenosidivorans]
MRKHIVAIAYICRDIFMSHEGPKGGTSLFTETGTLLFTDYRDIRPLYFAKKLIIRDD